MNFHLELDGARATLFEVADLVGAPGVSGLIGAVSFDDADAGRALLAEACRHFAARGAARVLGPMDGSTWRAYRLVLPPGEQPAPPGGVALPSFPGEPTNPPDAADAWRAAGFEIVARYESSIVLDLSAAVAGLPPPGVRIRPLALERYDDELDVLFDTSLRGFAANPYYAPIGRDEFRALYLPLRPLVDPAFVEIAEDDAGRVLGFLLCYPWSGAEAPGRPVLIAKTIAVVPEARGRGLGGLLFARAHAHARARERGFGAVVHALMHESNLSTRLSGDQHAQPFRRYALFGRTP